MSPPKVVRSAFAIFFEYDTPRIVHIRSKKVGVINRLLQLAIIGYVIGYAIYYKKGYQEFDDVTGAVTTKLKGVVYTNVSFPGLDGRIWDVGDYVIPPQENGAFFVMTNVLVTPDQVQDVCQEDPTIEDGTCNNTTKPCVPDQPVISGNGVKTGECVPSSHNASIGVCMIRGWCPVEDKNLGPKNAVLGGSADFTVFIKNNIEFPNFGVRRRNIVGFPNETALSNCRFDPNDSLNKFCPIFLLRDIVRFAGYPYESIADEGGVIQVIIDWDCNLDFDVDDCLPAYTFRRLDKGDYKLTQGYNFRYADHYKINGSVNARTLYKATGILFVVTVQGQAGKFNLVPLLTNFGAGLAILSVATIVCDIIVLYFLKARHFYKKNKYLEVKGDDAYEILDESQGEADKSYGATRRRQPADSHGSLTGSSEQ